MSPYVEFVLVIMLPTALGYGLILTCRGIRWASGRRPFARAPELEPIERLTATLRRLRAELESLETRTGIPNKNMRVRAVRGAYLDALASACQRLAVAPPRGLNPQRFDQADVYRVESQLREHGVDVREPAAH